MSIETGSTYPLSASTLDSSSHASAEQKWNATLNKIPQFKGYKVTLPSHHPCEGLVLTGLSLRPANLFFDALFKSTSITTTLPGSAKLFAFSSAAEIRSFCKLKSELTPHEALEFSAQGISGSAVNGMGKLLTIKDLSEIYGNNSYRLTYREIQETLNSQKIYLSSLLPSEFYRGLKKAMAEEHLVVLPGDDVHPAQLSELKKGNDSVAVFLREVEKNSSAYGFASQKSWQDMLAMTIYQLGSMVIKIEDYRVFIDGDCKLLERFPGQQDQIRLINACGIRGIHASRTGKQFNQQIMTETFKTAFQAAEKGIIVFPAVGMGVWRGDPDLYWRAFLDAVIESSASIEKICINPGHQSTRSGKYQGCMGEELGEILAEYRAKFQNQMNPLNQLNKIINLFVAKKDLVQLARELKQAYPHKIISLFNASDPDVTLGYHVGEYVNNMPHTVTTEENYTAMGTNGLCFEEITGVHEHPERIIQSEKNV